MKQGTAEICLMFVLGFFSFYLAENLGFSGIISIFCFVVVAANYSQKFLSEKTFQSIDSLFKSGAFLAESIAFVYLGFQAFQVFTADDLGKILFLSGFVLLAIGIIRWISIGMPAFLFLCYEDLRVEPSELVLIWYSGLIRGAVSVALIFSFHADKTDQMLRKIVLVVSLMTSLAFGSASLFVTKKLGFGETNMR
jgi:NhaP-type Na+/H+ or K+/H+ antiporter